MKNIFNLLYKCNN